MKNDSAGLHSGALWQRAAGGSKHRSDEPEPQVLPLQVADSGRHSPWKFMPGAYKVCVILQAAN